MDHPRAGAPGVQRESLAEGHALGRAGIVDGCEHRCRSLAVGTPSLCRQGEPSLPKDRRALWIRPLPKKGIVFHSLRNTTRREPTFATTRPRIPTLPHDSQNFCYQFATASVEEPRRLARPSPRTSRPSGSRGQRPTGSRNPGRASGLPDRETQAGSSPVVELN